MFHLLKKNAGRLKLFAENHRDSVPRGGLAHSNGSFVTPVNKGKTEVTL